MADVNIDELVVVNLKYSTRTKSQKDLALADLTGKALYSKSSPEKLKIIKRTVSALAGVSIEEKQVQIGLDLLEADKKVKKTVEGDTPMWTLVTEEREQIKKQLMKADLELEGVLNRHFPSDIETEKLKLWFREVSAAFFGHYGQIWVASVSKHVTYQPPQNKQIYEFLKGPTDEHGLKGKKQALIEGYKGFLTSDNNDDLMHLMNMGLAMFSSRLVAAGIGVDPLTLDELRGSKFILDTNLLLAIKLQDPKILSALNALGNALKSLDSKLVYIRLTMEEYERVVDYQKDNTLTLVDAYSDEIIAEASEDEFISNARRTGAKTSNDYKKFFDQLRELPTSLVKGLPIELEEDNIIEEKIFNAQQDNRLKQTIEASRKERDAARQIVAQTRPRSIQHDAALIYVANFLREDEGKCWILSLDKVLQTVSFEMAGPHGNPTVISLDALIEILAINGAGPEFKSTDFAPLLANILRNQCLPSTTSFDSKDLIYLHSLYSDAAKLPKENILTLVREINRIKMEGKSLDHPRVQAKIQKAYGRQVEDYDTKLRSTELKVTQNQEKLQKETEEKNRLFSIAVALKKREIKRKALLKFVARLIPRLCVIVILYLLVFHGIAQLSVNHMFFAIIAAITSILTLIGWIKSPFVVLRSQFEQSEELAQKEVKKSKA